MVEFTGKLTKSGVTYKISVPNELVNDKTVPLHVQLTARILEPEKPFKVLVPTLQGKVMRFQQGFGLVIDAAFLQGHILGQRKFYKVVLPQLK
jgi:hypothetical protein